MLVIPGFLYFTSPLTYIFYLYSRTTHVEDLISPRQFQLKHLFIARLIHRCGYFIVKVGERCSSLPRWDLFRIEAFLCEGARDFAWVLLRVLGLPITSLTDPVKSKGCVSSTHNMCLWVVRLSSMVTAHLLNFRL